MRAILMLLQAVIVQPPSATIVPTMQRLHEICGTAIDYDACTLFVAYRLDVTCDAKRLNASVTFRPMILLHNVRQLPHEKLHVDDVRLFASQYACELEKQVFASNEECQEESIRLAAGFGAKMREFALRSNLARHPQLRRSTMAPVEGR